jgi:hypothetical protein
VTGPSTSVILLSNSVSLAKYVQHRIRYPMRTQQGRSFKIPMPEWLTGDVLDVRMTVMQWLSSQPHSGDDTDSATPVCRVSFLSAVSDTSFPSHDLPIMVAKFFLLRSVSAVTGVSLTLTNP